MTPDQWDGLTEDACGAWNSNPNTELGQARLKSWTKRWQLEDFALFTRALRQLEQSHKHWPSVSEVHAVVDALKRAGGQGDGKAETPARLGPRDWAKLSRDLCHAVERSLRRTNGQGGEYTTHLQNLADLYSENARLSANGEPIKWPPWKFFSVPVGLNPNAPDKYRKKREERRRDVEGLGA